MDIFLTFGSNVLLYYLSPPKKQLCAEDDIMHVTLQKREKGQTWSSPIQGQGQLDPYTTDQEQRRLMLQRFQEEVSASIPPSFSCNENYYFVSIILVVSYASVYKMSTVFAAFTWLICWLMFLAPMSLS